MLFCRLANGDEDAFRQLFHHYNKLLQPFVAKLTRSPNAAEEVLQEVFLKIWAHRKKLAAVDNPKAYIIRIVSNESMNYLQAQAKHERLAKEMLRIPIDAAPSPEQSFFHRETEQCLQQAVEQLPLACRQIYRMSREQYKRIPEIASELNLSHSTVKNQLVKALKTIRLHLGNILPSLIAFFMLQR
ncbi:RNA polymerase sigma-70 factor [Flavitalea sp. BT771]|nr:RNA polymerase sigma-70 factor [Flavitalea sp. BT771]MDV6219859.1 RNA polymerase sigma-70 factor [Flavitalea sp. BT771]